MKPAAKADKFALRPDPCDSDRLRGRFDYPSRATPAQHTCVTDGLSMPATLVRSCAHDRLSVDGLAFGLQE
jgi:hypothetical protein